MSSWKECLGIGWFVPDMPAPVEPSMFSTQNAKNAFDFFFWRAEENCFDRALLNQPKGNEWSEVCPSTALRGRIAPIRHG